MSCTYIKDWSENLNKFKDNISCCLLDENFGMYINFDEFFRDLCTFGHLDTVKLFIEKKLVKIDVINDGFSSACNNGHIDIINFLISEDLPLDFNEGLEYACKGGHIQIAKLMIYSSNTPLDFQRSADIMCGKYFYKGEKYSKRHMEVVDLLALHTENIYITEYEFDVIYKFDDLIDFYREYKKTQVFKCTKLHESLVDFILKKI